jgi:hypothetical protein
MILVIMYPFLYGMCVNLIPRHTYYEYSIWVLKSGMTSHKHSSTGAAFDLWIDIVEPSIRLDRACVQ